jgi:hypothetical protein
MPHQAGLGFALGDVKSCISLTPLGLWEQHEALQTAVVKALTGSSCGITCSSSSSKSNSATKAAEVLAGQQGAAATAAAAVQWMCLSRNKLVSCNLLSCKPGQVATAACVELEARAQPPSKLLLMVKSAGGLNFRTVKTQLSQQRVNRLQCTCMNACADVVLCELVDEQGGYSYTPVCRWACLQDCNQPAIHHVYDAATRCGNNHSITERSMTHACALLQAQ